MSRKHFSGLLIAAVLVLAVVFALLPSRTGQESGRSENAWLADLAERVNDIDHVELTVPGGTVAATLQRGDSQWTIAELGDYPADWAKLRDVLAALARARIIEPKTASPEYYDRLGVEDVASEAASGVLLTMVAGDDRWSVIVGKAADSREGRYLRRADDEQSVLADFDAELPRTAIGWADAEIIDLPAANVAEVEIIHPDRNRILVRKVSADETDYTLDNLPENRELQSTWSANALGGVLAALRMEDVRKADSLDWSNPLLVRVLTFDGFEVRVEAVEEADAHWLRLLASAPFASVVTTGPESVPDGEDADESLDPGRVAEDLQARVEAFNAKVSAWAYKLPSYKFDSMNKRLEDLLKPLDGNDAEAGR